MGFLVIVNLAARTLALYQNQRHQKAYPVGVGKMLTPTPTGTFQIVNKVPHPGGPFGVMWLGLTEPHYGIHGTNRPDSIGQFVSKGCIRMYNQDVLELARIVPLGTSVIILP